MADFTLEEVKTLTMVEIAAAQANRYDDKIFLHYLPTGEKISYADFDRRTNRIGAALLAHGIGRGDHVGLMLDNNPEIVLSVVSLTKCGAVWAPVNTAVKGKLLTYYLDLADAKALVVNERYLPLLEACLQDLPRVKLVVVVEDGSGSVKPRLGSISVLRFSQLETVDATPHVFSSSPYEMAALLFTSGTTGPSKAIMWSQAGINFWCTQNAIARTVSADDIEYTCLPMFHANALLNSTLTSFMAGASVALTDKYSTTRFWGEIRASRATRFNSLGAVANFLWAQPPGPGDRDHDLRVCSMAPVPAYAAQFEERFGVRIFTGYGLSDYCLAASTRPDDPPEKRFSCGRPRDGVELRIVDENDIDVAPGSPGEIVLRIQHAWGAATGYYKLPEATLESRRNLLFHTGDRGYLDKDGYLYFLDRKKDSIRRRGENISTQEVESVVNSHPDVVSSAVYPLRAEMEEDEVAVSALLRPGSALTCVDLIRYCADNMSYFMVPRFVEFVHELPLTPSGKVEKYKLRERAENNPSLWDREAEGLTVTRRGLEQVRRAASV